MGKAEILVAIRRIAKANGGKAPGSQKLQTELNLGKADWYPKYWLRWSDAVREAGLEPNKLSARFDEDFLIKCYVDLTRELGRFPIEGDLMVKRNRDSSFPSRDTFWQLGSKSERAAKVLAYVRKRTELQSLIPLVESAVVAAPSQDEEPESISVVGYVYLVRHGQRREYKIGRTNNPLRREGEIGIELPQTLKPIHVIATDDPSGVEAYWHRRFADKRLKNEWFALAAPDVQAFKKWKRIV